MHNHEHTIQHQILAGLLVLFVVLLFVVTVTRAGDIQRYHPKAFVLSRV